MIFVAAAKALKLLAGALAVLWLGACEGGVPQLTVVQANYAYGRGQYQDAIVRYFDTIESEDYRGYVAYNLANAYHALGESEAALELWDEAEQAELDDLSFGIRFNRGLLFYERGRYRQAYDQFRAALEIESNSVEAKRNLELAFQRIQAGAGLDQAERAERDSDHEPSAETSRVLEYIRRREDGRWFATETPELDEVELYW